MAAEEEGRAGGVAANSASFCARGSRLSAASALSAAERPRTRRAHTSTTGRRERVYLAPVPALWRATRVGKSFDTPAYSEPSRQRTR